MGPNGIERLNMILLAESKRDDLLLPYFELVKDKFPGLTLGKFKGVMLDKLAAQGNINNLSLGSNFYLAGATKYYFQGQLTTDGQANLLKGDVNIPDNWNNDACRKLNIVINILRDAYIDSVGTKFEIEEDFGNLSINKLFRKYGKKINAALGNDNPEAAEPEDTLDRNPRVGNGYSFDILHCFEDATKYNQYTSPGAWCITYGDGHYRYYTSRYNAHFVIFLKDGYQNVERKTGPGYTKRKPHDEYGNSMIAYLQSNTSWKPTLITSRWNHGHGETTGTEADYAYNLEEFCEITGVTPEDLQRIFEIWKKDAPKEKNKSSAEEKKEFKAAMVPVLRRLKYAQMMINNGKGVTEALSEAGARFTACLQGDRESNKNVSVYSIEENNLLFQFMKDRNNIIFDTLSDAFGAKIQTLCSRYGLAENIGNDIIIVDYGNYNKLYSIRYHSFIDVGGVTKFKKIPNARRGDKNPALMEVKNSFKDIALISLSNSKPLKLPNGQYWCNAIITTYSGWDRGNEITAHFWSTTNTPIIEIIYDESSGEQYFYSLTQRKFIEGLNKITNSEQVNSYAYGAIQDPKQYLLRLNTEMHPITNYFSVCFTPDGALYHSTKKTLVDKAGNMVSIYGINKFGWLNSVDDRIILYRKEKTTYYDIDAKTYAYDTRFKKLLAIGDKPVDAKNMSTIGRNYAENKGTHRFLTVGDTNWGNRTQNMIYDATVGLFIKNPFTGRQFFEIDEGYEIDGSDTSIKKDEFDKWDYIQQLRAENVSDVWDRLREEEKKHQVPLLSLNFEYYENTLPENNEYDHGEENVSQEAQPAVSLAEGRLNESKRDDLLLPYLEITKAHGVEMTLGQFKTRMLEILGAQGGIHNLSLGSNYYLAGVTKYYFNGDLTLNKDLAIFKNDIGASDQWNEEVCQRIDALVLILRNAYIDSVGTQFELEEDFGTLSLPKLLRKYNKKINDALGIVSDKPKKNKEGEEEKVYDPNVGNGYTYKILYSFADGREFERPTAPGSWCITYGDQYYRSYMRNLGIHYVIFLKNGYENIERKTGPGYTKQKPHDAYGNSMIAFLQSNSSWEGVYITSRWNHGSAYDNTSGTEADHAYTNEEFCQITGVSPDDLKRIWQEWNEKKTKVHRETDPHKAELREEKKQMLRRIKYAQMRLNGGELPQNLFILKKKIMGNDNPDGTVNFKKGIFVAQLKPTTNEESFYHHYKFVIDRGKIIFESLTNYAEAAGFIDSPTLLSSYVDHNGAAASFIKNAMVIPVDGGYLIYDTRKKDCVTVDGAKKFKYIIDKWANNRRGAGEGTPLFYLVAQRSQQMAFIQCSNNEPLKLPNGECWFSEYHTPSSWNQYRGRSVSLTFAGFPTDGIIEIVYDSSSREKYFYSTTQRRFIDMPDISDVRKTGGYTGEEVSLSAMVNIKGLYGLKYGNNPWGWHCPLALFNERNERVSIGGLTTFCRAQEVNEYDSTTGKDNPKGIYILELTSESKAQLVQQGYEIPETSEEVWVVYDKSIDAFLVVEGNKVIPGDSNNESMRGKYLFYRVYVSPSGSLRAGGIYGYYIYDTETHGILINPCGYPTKYIFEEAGWNYDDEGKTIEVFPGPRNAGESYWNDSRPKTTYQLAKLKMDRSTAQIAQRNNGSQYSLSSSNLSPNAVAPALSLSEGDIKKMVNEVIRKITSHIL